MLELLTYNEYPAKRFTATITIHAHYHIDSYGILKFPSENTASITHSENTTFTTVNDVTLQKASLLKRSLNVSFLSNLLSFFSMHLFQTPQIWMFKHQYNALSIFEWINHTCLTPCWCVKFIFDIGTHVAHEANWK